MPLWRRILCFVLGVALLYVCFQFGLMIREAEKVRVFILAGLGLSGFVGIALMVTAIDPRRF